MLVSLDSTEARRHVPHDDIADSSISLANQIISVADIVINSIDQEKLLAYFGMKSDQRPDAAKIKTTMEKQRNSLTEALIKKGSALARLYVNSLKNGDGDGQQKSFIESFTNVWKDVLKFSEATDSKVRSSILNFNKFSLSNSIFPLFYFLVFLFYRLLYFPYGTLTLINNTDVI